VVRITNSRIICQIIYATLVGDRVLCQADSKELQKFGLTAGLTNYPAAYCTGLLLARRLLQDKGLDKHYPGKEEADGQRYDVSKLQAEAEQRPFKAHLDVGLQRTTTGSRVFGALKGACDGGLYIPHHTRRFPGSSKSNKRKAVKYSAEAHRSRIYGLHIETYTYGVEDEDAELYEKRFAKWSKCLDDNSTESYEELYKKVHQSIRADPSFTKKVSKARKHDFSSEKLM
jgi:large subunit ribosomal protein L5e